MMWLKNHTSTVNDMLDEYGLENIAHDHRIGAGLFIPFVISRLQGTESALETILTITLRGVGSVGERQKNLRLFWEPSSAFAEPLGI